MSFLIKKSPSQKTNKNHKIIKIRIMCQLNLYNQESILKMLAV